MLAAQGRAGQAVQPSQAALLAPHQDRRSKGMHNLLKEHTLTALSPKMSNFFISSATTMSWGGKERSRMSAEHPASSGRGWGSIPYCDTFGLAVHLQRAPALREGAVQEGDGRGAPLPLLEGQTTCLSDHKAPKNKSQHPSTEQRWSLHHRMNGLCQTLLPSLRLKSMKEMDFPVLGLGCSLNLI